MALEAAIAPLERRMDIFEMRLDNLSLRLAVRLGAMQVVTLGVLATLMKLT